ncbi:MAG TPA: type II secretion system protein [Candidatus Dormibacteraeota bacterium]
MDDLFNRVIRRRRRGQKGFTLIELLVVIAVLAILAGIVIFNVLGVTNRGSSSACATDEKSVQTASDAYYNDHNKTYATSGGGAGTLDSALLSPAYLHTYPTEQAWAIDANGTVTNTC